MAHTEKKKREGGFGFYPNPPTAKKRAKSRVARRKKRGKSRVPAWLRRQGA